MSIEFRCSQCGQLLRVPADSAGKHARCPKCQALMAVPQADANAPSSPVPVPDAAPAAPTLSAPPPPQPLPPPEKPASESPFTPASASALGTSAAAAGNPFSEAVGENPFAGPAKGNLNPYASPAGFASYKPAYDMTGLRTGLPWDVEPRTFSCWFRTVRAVLGMPSQAFLMMHQHGGLGPPIQYSIYGIGMPVAAAMMLAIPILLLVFLTQQPAGDVSMTTGGIALAGVGIVLFAALYVVIAATAGNLVAAAIWHLFLMLVGGARQPFETTFRVTSYVYGSLMWLQFIPYIGGCAAGIWTIVLLIIGLSKAHEVPASKPMLAILLPIGVCVGLYFLFFLTAIVGPVLFERLGR